MTQHLCPECKNTAFTWSMGDDERTWWHCSSCEYRIGEDECKETFCQKCRTPYPTVSYLMENDTRFYWCTTCGDRNDVP